MTAAGSDERLSAVRQDCPRGCVAGFLSFQSIYRIRILPSKGKVKKRGELLRNFYIDGQKIRDFRSRERLTQRELAQKCGVSQPQLGRYERGITPEGVTCFVAVAKACGLTVDELVLTVGGEEL
jgi:DNA-binding XRE family transcriptional regulator